MKRANTCLGACFFLIAGAIGACASDGTTDEPSSGSAGVGGSTTQAVTTGTGGSGGEGSDDACPNDATQSIDTDGDGYCEKDDKCPNDPLQWSDGDGDGYCDEIDDKCPNDPLQWTDKDGDGYCDEIDDKCPDDGNGICDSNLDGKCDGEDDCDGDGVTDGEEKAYGADCSKSDLLIKDTDEDGINDNADPYPRDPFPEFIVHRNEMGSIDFALSKRDGTFLPPTAIGAAYGCTNDAPHNCNQGISYRYTHFIISDFDGDGRVDFLAIGDAKPTDNTNPRDLWWFTRLGVAESGDDAKVQQRLVEANLEDTLLAHVAGDFNNDYLIDLALMKVTKPSYITDVKIDSYENTGMIGKATCAYTTDTANPKGCAFIRRQAADLQSWGTGQWVVRIARDAVDLTGNGHRDLAVLNISSGGNVAVPVYVVEGQGNMTFTPPNTAMFSHNSGNCGNSPANSILFADFDADNIGDIVVGLDDDGDPGSAWFYPGQVSGGMYGFDFAKCVEAFDINTNSEKNGSNQPGATSSTRTFDFDFDGFQDVIVGFPYSTVGNPPTRTEVWLGKGDGTFKPPLTVRDFADNWNGVRFAVPQRICPSFPKSP